MLSGTSHTNGTSHGDLDEPDLILPSLFDAVSLPACLSTIDRECFVAVNEAWARLFGYSSEEVIGRTAADLDI